MKFKNLLVSEDNQLVLSDYGLSEEEVEVTDLNKSLNDVATDEELKTFIKETSSDPQKIYIYCVKEDFGNNDQILQDVPNIKKVGKAVKKAFKKQPNIYFFIYNTHAKNESEINPELDTVTATPVEHEEPQVEPTSETTPVEEGTNEPETIEEETPVEEEVANEDLPFAPEEEPVAVASEDLPEEPTEEETTPEEEVKEEPKTGVICEECECKCAKAHCVCDCMFCLQCDLKGKAPEEEPTAVELEEAVKEEPAEEAVEEVLAEEEPDLLAEVVESPQEFEEGDTFEEVEVDDEGFLAVEPEELPIEEELYTPQTKKDVDDIDKAIGDEQYFMDENSEAIKEDILESQVVEATPSEDAVLFDEPKLLEDDEVPITTTIDESVEEVGEKEEVPKDEVYKDEETEVEMPVTYFDTEKEPEISYEDYQEFVNDYELNIHALKSIYDFIWRILVLNNHNLKLSDLLFIAVNNLDVFSVGQSDFVRQTANKADSLFDLILQLDVKLEFNNSLFYIYLAEFFQISGNKILVNKKFLDTISIWVNKESKKRFIAQVEQFMNYSSIYNKKIIYSYFIELANAVKGRLPSINPDITLLDIHRLLNNKYNKIRKENVFGFMVSKMNQILAANGVVVEMYLVKTPDNLFGIKVNETDASESDNWKTQMAKLYHTLMTNIQNYVLLKGNKESEIFNLFLDIRDLRMYEPIEGGQNVLSPETVSVLSSSKPGSYLTIGDEMNRALSIVPSQEPESSDASYVTPQTYLENVEKGYDMKQKKIETENLITIDSQMNTYPSEPEIKEDAADQKPEDLKEKYENQLNVAEFENSLAKRIEEYEIKIKNNIAKIAAERKQLREKMEELKNL